MKILVSGAGVLGCNLARNLFRAGKDVTLLARGCWAEEIRQNGLRIKDKFSPRVSVSRIPVTTELKPEALQARTSFSFGSAEEHCKYRDAVMKAYPHGRFPVFEGYNHMQNQIRDPQGFAQMLVSIMETGSLPELPFVRK